MDSEAWKATFQGAILSNPVRLSNLVESLRAEHSETVLRNGTLHCAGCKDERAHSCEVTTLILALDTARAEIDRLNEGPSPAGLLFGLTRRAERAEAQVAAVRALIKPKRDAGVSVDAVHIRAALDGPLA